MKTFKEIYQYRELLKTSVRKDIRGRYKGSFLGILWSFINPLLQVLVYYIVFPILMRGTIPNYVVYLICGLLPWTYFQSSIMAATGCIKANSGIIKKVYFPRQILVLSQVLSGLINFFISVPIILVFCLLFQIPLTWHMLWIPVIAVIEALLIYGLSLILSAINVYVQDVEYIIQFVLNMMFYGTPIIYTLDMLSGQSLLSSLVSLNPMTILVNAYRTCIMYDGNPGWRGLLAVLALALLLCAFGSWVFNRLQRGFAEEL